MYEKRFELLSNKNGKLTILFSIYVVLKNIVPIQHDFYFSFHKTPQRNKEIQHILFTSVTTPTKTKATKYLLHTHTHTSPQPIFLFFSSTSKIRASRSCFNLYKNSGRVTLDARTSWWRSGLASTTTTGSSKARVCFERATRFEVKTSSETG